MNCAIQPGLVEPMNLQKASTAAEDKGEIIPWRFDQWCLLLYQFTIKVISKLWLIGHVSWLLDSPNGYRRANGHCSQLEANYGAPNNTSSHVCRFGVGRY